MSLCVNSVWETLLGVGHEVGVACVWALSQGSNR